MGCGYCGVRHHQPALARRRRLHTSDRRWRPYFTCRRRPYSRVYRSAYTANLSHTAGCASAASVGLTIHCRSIDVYIRLLEDACSSSAPGPFCCACCHHATAQHATPSLMCCLPPVMQAGLTKSWPASTWAATLLAQSQAFACMALQQAQLQPAARAQRRRIRAAPLGLHLRQWRLQALATAPLCRRGRRGSSSSSSRGGRAVQSCRQPWCGSRASRSRRGSGSCARARVGGCPTCLRRACRR